MQIDASGSTIANVLDSLQVYQSLAEITKKLETEPAFRNYVTTVTEVFASEISFALRSSLTRGRAHVPAAVHPRNPKHHRGQSVHIQGELPTDFDPNR